MRLPALAAIALALVAFPAIAATPARLIADYDAAYRALGMAQLQLPYQQNIRTLLRETDIPAQRAMFDDFARRLRSVDDTADACQRLDLARIGFEIESNQRKLDVLAAYTSHGARATLSDDGLARTTEGPAWYRYFLRRWLTADVTPEQLSALGRAELAAAQARYRQLQAAMGYAGRDQAFYDYLASASFRYPDGQTPQADYEARQATVYRNLGKLFPAAGIAPARIAESERGATFMADGYYDSDAQTFYFNKSRGYYGRRDLDWLILHESTPGHHFQNHYAAQAHGCASKAPYVFYSAFAEGWGAYVEEFGAELGLYRIPSDELGAVEWNLVRSIRVVLDVGINHDGWSRPQALDYWRRELPMLPALAEREVTRVRDWPVQAITYKYGADVIRRLRAAEQARLGAAFDIRVFHDAVMKNGPLPLAVLPGTLGH